MKKIFFLFFTCFLLSCSQSTSSGTAEGKFAIYLLEDSTLGASNAYSQSIENLVLNNEAFISADDLKSYKWTSHSFELKDVKRTEFENFRIQQGSTRGIPFLVTVGKDRIYFGTFWWAYSSSLPPKCAIIDATGPLPHRIGLVEGAEDKRNDKRIFNSLKASGVLEF